MVVKLFSTMKKQPCFMKGVYLCHNNICVAIEKKSTAVEWQMRFDVEHNRVTFTLHGLHRQIKQNLKFLLILFFFLPCEV